MKRAPTHERLACLDSWPSSGAGSRTANQALTAAGLAVKRRRYIGKQTPSIEDKRLQHASQLLPTSSRDSSTIKKKPATAKAKTQVFVGASQMKPWDDIILQHHYMPHVNFPEEFSKRLIDNLQADDLGMVHTNLSSLATTSNARDPSVHLKIATMCAGSDIVLTMFPHLQNELSRVLGIAILFDHRWSCEVDPQKQNWIRQNFAVPRLFDDINDLSQSHGAMDIVTGTQCIPEEVDMILAGISCKDASRLSVNQKDRRTTVSEGTFSTGSTFEGLIKYVKKLEAKPKLIIIENVLGLKDKPLDNPLAFSNFQTIQKAFDMLGYLFIDVSFDVADTGLPCRRNRLWMAAIYYPICAPGSEEFLSVKDRSHIKTMKTLQDLLASCKKYSLRDVLIQEYQYHNHTEMLHDWWPDVSAFEDDFDPPEVAPGKFKWLDQHQKLWQEIGDEKKKMKMMNKFSNNIWFKSVLTPRQQDLLCILECQHSSSSANSTDETVWDLNPSAYRVSKNTNAAPCMLPRNCCWLQHRERPLAGVESLILQGADIRKLPSMKPGVWSSKFLQDLGGNAFNTAQCATFLVSVLSAMPV